MFVVSHENYGNSNSDGLGMQVAQIYFENSETEETEESKKKIMKKRKNSVGTWLQISKVFYYFFLINYFDFFFFNLFFDFF